MESTFGNVDNYRVMIRDKKGCFLLHPFKSKTDKEFCLEQCSSITTSKKYFAVINQGKLSLFLTKDCSLCKEFNDLENVCAVHFSQKEAYLTIIQKPVIEKNLKVFNLNDNFSLIHEFRSQVHPNTEWPQIQFSHDEKFVYFHNKQTVEIYNEDRQIINSIENILAFEDILYSDKLNENNKIGNHLLVCSEVVPQGKKGKKCFFTTFDFTDLSKPIRKLPTSLTDRVKLKLSLDQKYLLLNTINDNTTNQSYYGQSSLYFYEIFTGKFNKFSLQEGPIHDFNWCPDGEHFLVVAGHLPSTVYYYNKDGSLNKQITKGNINTIKISPDNRIVALCGFGSLKGDIEFYSLVDFKIIGKANLFCCVNFNWSQDSKYLLGAVLSTRVKVDNEYRIFKYNGEEVIVDKEIGEIYDCIFIYEEDESKIKYTEFPIEANAKSLEVKKTVNTFSTLGAIDFSKGKDKNMGNDDGIVGLGPKKKKKKKKELP